MSVLPPHAGLGVRAAHYPFLDRMVPAAWHEVHSENFFASGGVHWRLLDRLAARAPLSFHGVGLAPGSAAPLDEEHLACLAGLVRRFQPALVSEHLCWGHAGGWHANDLLPMPYSEQAVAHLADRIGRIQDRLGRRIAVENVSCYVRFTQDEMPEWEFVRAVCERADCLLLLDVANIHVNARNHGFDPASFLAGVPHRRVVEIHLAGHQVLPWGLVDTHDGPVPSPVWALYRQALAWCGPVATVVEWDHDLPALDTLLDQGRLVQAALDQARAAGPAGQRDHPDGVAAS